MMTPLRKPLSIMCLSMISLFTNPASADQSKHGFLSASDSDPKKLEWMLGFPPAPDKRIMHPQSDYFSFPKLRWTVCHIRELLPTKQVSKGLGNSKALTYKLDSAIDQIRFKNPQTKKSMTWAESLDANYTDGILVIHKNHIVYENYTGCLNDEGKHAAMSMTKSMTGLLAEILIAEGSLDENRLVSEIIPELKQSAFGDATIRQVMDMTTGLKYSENYADPQADIWIYSAAANPLPKPSSYQGPNGYFEYLQTVKKEGKHGQVFGYKTINSDVLGWIISKVTGKSFTDLLAEKIWKKIGAEQDAYMTVDALGTPFAGGGLSAGLRDLGRIGLLMLNNGSLFDEQVFSPSVVKNIRRGGDKKAFSKSGYTGLKNASYRSMWWMFHNKHEAYAARGVHGQTIYIDPRAEMVIVRYASYPTAKNANIDPTSLPAFQALAEYLLKAK